MMTQVGRPYAPERAQSKKSLADPFTGSGFPHRFREQWISASNEPSLPVEVQLLIQGRSARVHGFQSQKV
jgi:hypothetical protein